MSVPIWSEEEFAQLLDGGGALLVDWRADWCTNCAAEEKVIERLAPELEERVQLGMIDVGACPELAERFGVMSLPTIAVFVEGRQVESISGFRRAPEIREIVHRALHPA